MIIFRANLTEQDEFELAKAGWCLGPSRIDFLVSLGESILDNNALRIESVARRHQISEAEVEALKGEAVRNLRAQLENWNAQEDQQETCYFASADLAEQAVRNFMETQIEAILEEIRSRPEVERPEQVVVDDELLRQVYDFTRDRWGREMNRIAALMDQSGRTVFDHVEDLKGETFPSVDAIISLIVQWIEEAVGEIKAGI